jgi:SAM-dependent methyltransferase
MRGVALGVPPIRRLYDYAMQQARENQERAAMIAALTTRQGETTAVQTTCCESQSLSEPDSAMEDDGQIRSNVEFWKQLQERDYFETHPCYNGLVDMGDSECGVIEWFLPLSKDMNAVVIGCGYGRETVHLAKRIAHVYGIDVNSTILTKAVQYLGENGVTNFTPVEAQKYRHMIPQGIDLVFSIVVMQHLTRDLVRDYFAGLGSLLKPGGRMVIQFLEDLGAHRQTEAELKAYEPSVSWTIPEIVELCRHAGLRMELARTYLATETALWHWISASPAR